MKKAFRKSLKRQASLGYFSNSSKNQSNNINQHELQDQSGTPILLWRAFARKYQFNYPNDWYRWEAHWLDQIEGFQEQPIDCPGRDNVMNNAIIRISQCNESYQLCNSLPKSFIVPKDLNDVTLSNVMSTVIKDHRVPIISYCCPIEYRRNFIIRTAACPVQDQQVNRVVTILEQAVKPMKVFNLNSVLPSPERLNSAHKKLTDVCRPGNNHVSNFFSKTGKWLNIISLTLKEVKEITRTLLTQASVLLIEDSDKGWNCLVSSLLQILLEPHRRTIEGLESLISKEWIYLSGGQADTSKPDLHFVLFLNCIYQLYLQNTNKFEFNDQYLRYLYQTHFSTIATNVHNNHNNNNNNSTSTEESNIEASVSLNNNNINNNITKMLPSIESVDVFENKYSEEMLNLSYQPDSDSPTLQLYDHIANVKLWSSLYLHWLEVPIHDS